MAKSPENSEANRLSGYNQTLGALCVLIHQQESNMDPDSRKSIDNILSRFRNSSNKLLNTYEGIIGSNQYRMMRLQATNTLFMHEAKSGYLTMPKNNGPIPIQASASDQSASQSNSKVAKLSGAPALSHKSGSKSSSASANALFSFSLNTSQSTSDTGSKAQKHNGSSSVQDWKSSYAKSLKNSIESEQESKQAKKSLADSKVDSKRSAASSISNSISSSAQSVADSKSASNSRADSLSASKQASKNAANGNVQFKPFSDPNSAQGVARGKATSTPTFSTTIQVPKTSSSQPKPKKHGLNIKRHLEKHFSKHKTPQRAVGVKRPNLNKDFVKSHEDKDSTTSSAQKEASKYRPKSSQDGRKTSAPRSTENISKKSQKLNVSELGDMGADLFGDEHDSGETSVSSSSADKSSASSTSASSKSSWDPNSYLNSDEDNDDISIPKSTLKKQREADKESLDKSFNKIVKNAGDVVDPDHKFEIQRRHMKALSGEDVSSTLLKLFGKIAGGDYGYKQFGLSHHDYSLMYNYYFNGIKHHKHDLHITTKDANRIRDIISQLQRYIQSHPEFYS